MARPRDLSNLDGVQVTVDEGMGRVLRATRDFTVGSTLLIEKPLLVFRDVNDLYQQFELLDGDKKAKVLDLKHTEISTPAATKRGQAGHKKWKLSAAEVARRNDGITLDLFFKLASVADINAHAYRNDVATYTEGSGNTQPVKSALFSIASKAAHSCSPNCSYSTRFHQGYMTMMATKPIASGDLITISYISEALFGSTEARRMKLEAEKDFYCSCPRCVGPDYVRGIRCAQPGCNGIKLGTMGRDDDAYSWVSWRCQECGDEKDATSRLEKIESKIQRLLDRFKHKVQLGQITNVLPDSIGEALTKAATELSPTHFLVADLYRVQAKCNVTIAASLGMEEGVNKSKHIQEHRLKSAQAGMNAIRTMECVDAGCLEGASVCSIVHNPINVCSTHALWVYKDLQLAFPGDLEKHIPFFERYLPFLAMSFGIHDEDVREIATYISQTLNRSKVESLSVCAWPGCTRKQGEGRLMHCSRCKKVAYCDKTCQVAHWKAGHKKECA